MYIIVWETIEHYRALQKDEPNYAKLKAGLKAVMVSREYLYHVNFPVDLTSALNAPVTEVAWVTIPSTSDKKEFTDLLQGFIAKIHQYLPEEIIAEGFAPTVEDENKLGACFGWRDLGVRAYFFTCILLTNESYFLAGRASDARLA